jgi:hypothetical protein
MKNFSLKALGAFIFAAGLVVAGVSAPAHAAESAGTISVNGFPAGVGTPGFTYTTGNSASGWTEITYTAQWSNNPQGFQPKNGCTGNNLTFANCAITSIQVGATIYTSASGVTLSAISNSNSYVPQMKFTFPSSQSGIVVVTFATGAWVPPQINGTYPFKATTNGSDSYTVDVTVTGAKSTVFMNKNIPNDYSMERQQASSPTALTANPFSQSGYSFAGWATSPTGAVVYTDGAQFNFFGPTSFNQSGAITQLYAVWTQGSGGAGGSSSSTPEVLANTGINSATGISLLAGGLSLALIGAEMFMIARRKRSN